MTQQTTTTTIRQDQLDQMLAPQEHPNLPARREAENGNSDDVIDATPQTAAIHPLDSARFAGAGTLRLSATQRAVLSEPLSVEEVDADRDRSDRDGRPMLYMSHSHVRIRLLRAFGPGGWALVPVTEPKVTQSSYTDGRGNLKTQFTVAQTWDLIVDGHYVSRATGEGQWIKGNPRTTATDALEASKSNALTRHGKDLGLGIELWTRAGRERIWAEMNGQKQDAAASAAPPVDAEGGEDVLRQAADLWREVLACCDDDEAKAKELLRDITSAPATDKRKAFPGYTDPQRLKHGWQVTKAAERLHSHPSYAKTDEAS